MKAAVLVALLLWSVLSLANDEVKQPVSYRGCPDWQAHIETLSEHTDPVAKRLGELYAEPEHQYCRLEMLPVKDDEAWDPELDVSLPNLALAEGARILLIAGLMVCCLWFLWRWWKTWAPVRRTRSKPSRAEQPDLGDAPAPPQEAPLPADIPAAARQAWQEKQPRHALSLLYRGAVDRLLGPDGNAEGLTENEVLRQIKRRSKRAGDDGQGIRRFMQNLIRCWLQTAWNHQPPSDSAFDSLLQQWQVHCRPDEGGAS